MKRFQLCASVTAMIIGVAVAGPVLAGDKGNGRQNAGGRTAVQSGGPKGSVLPGGGQVGSIANNLKNQGNMISQKQSNGTSDIKSKKIDPGQLTKKNDGLQGKNLPVKKDSNDPMHKDSGKEASKKQHFEGIKDHCYFGKDNYFWSEHCWNDRFGCETYFCSTRHCWYFWYEPFTCYLPCEYWSTYCEPVVEVSPTVVEVAPPVVEVAQPVVEVQPVRYIVRSYVVYRGPSFGFYGPSFPYYVRH
jgi:hypothetical protein